MCWRPVPRRPEGRGGRSSYQSFNARPVSDRGTAAAVGSAIRAARARGAKRVAPASQRYRITATVRPRPPNFGSPPRINRVAGAEGAVVLRRQRRRAGRSRCNCAPRPAGTCAQCSGWEASAAGGKEPGYSGVPRARQPAEPQQALQLREGHQCPPAWMASGRSAPRLRHALPEKRRRIHESASESRGNRRQPVASNERCTGTEGAWVVIGTRPTRSGMKILKANGDEVRSSVLDVSAANQ